jgi:site-specific recombinase XerD
MGEISVTAGGSLESAAAAASDYVLASKSANTIRAYRSDAKAFAAWCSSHGLEALPASEGAVASHLAALAQSGLRASSIARKRAAIAYLHSAAGFDSPTRTPAIRAVIAGIRRSIGVAPVRKAPATAEAISAMLGDDPTSLREFRDRALIALGFAGALRRSELVGLNVEDLEDTPEGVFIHIRRSKGDQEGQGQIVAIPFGAAIRPVRCVKDWIEASGITSGAIFRSLRKGGKIGGRLSSSAVATIIKNRAYAIGLDDKVFAGHSLRSGFVTSALSAGADILRVMDVTRHRQVNTLKVYDRRAKAFQDHAGAAFL